MSIGASAARFKIECKGTAFSRYVQINREKSFGFVDFARDFACYGVIIGVIEAVVKENLRTEMRYATVAFFATVIEKNNVSP